MSSSTQLTNVDRKWWAPAEQIVKKISDQIPEGATVLEIGPGYVPFPKATMFVDYRDLPNIPAGQKVSIDLCAEKLPFLDKAFDFVYCRHVLEDMYNPFLLLKEMERVAKAGYLETPSPCAELGRGVDGSSPPYRGYHHHRFILWAHEGELRIISKYPFIEYLRFDEAEIITELRKGPVSWNTHFSWTDKINWTHRQNGPDYEMTRDYVMILKDAVDQSKVSSSLFWLGLAPVTVQQSALPSLTQVA